MSQPAKMQEPSMEEILASIRRIIADDDGARPVPGPVKPAVVPVPPRAAVEHGAAERAAADLTDVAQMPAGFAKPQTPGVAANDVFELRDTVQSRPPETRGSDAASDHMFDDVQEAPDEAAPAPPAAPPAVAPAVSEAVLLSPRATAAVDMAFNALAHTVLVQNSRTLEDLVRELLKPMLKAWLDDNLPNMVERLVRSEIERVSRGRG
jgi:cell pole-organizing protein PopZ